MNERDLIQKWMEWKEESERKPFSQKILADSSGISPTYLSSIMTGARNAGTRTVERIAEAFGVTISEFYSGPPGEAGNREESVSVRNPPVPEEPNLFPPPREKPVPAVADERMESGRESQDDTGLKLFHSSPDEIERLFGSYGYALKDAECNQPARSPDPPREDFPENLPESPFHGGIPLLTHVPEGPWNEWFSPGSEAMFRTIPSPFAGDALFSVQLTDDSMSPALERGALVVADPRRLPIGFKGEIALVAYRGRFSIRRIYAVGESLVLVPVNPAFFPEIIPAEGAEVFVIAFHLPPRTIRS